MRGVLAQALDAILPNRATDPVALDGVAAAVTAQVTARWPAWLDPATFAAYLAQRIEPTADPIAELAEIHAVDLYLACACARGEPAAHAALERDYLIALPGAVRTIDGSSDFVDEVVQLVRHKLLVPDAGPPRIEAYSGHGPLGAFLRVTAIRLALSLRRRKHPEHAEDDLESVIDGSHSPELVLLARRIDVDLRTALRTAIDAQSPRTRAILRMYYGDGHGVEDIGRVYRVHASSISRWLARARAEILAATRAALLERLVATSSDIDSLLGHAASLEISLGSLLREP